ncbi:RNA polymerase sigma factor [Sediminicola luteus]|uniref:RNA polymerase subunit sigma-70 n=1 Tax=Sediminicola luteus TaxID=319238 RepID=A0A2A4G4U3_9FLAO|nr:RNA polymerase sigma factor [Sediminicola luteus]PCE62984.1 hypothetical protein B7P33_17055 [Sediminicola luteus]
MGPFKYLLLLFASLGKFVSHGSTKNLSDEELVELIKKSDNTLLFTQLYDRFSVKVYNKCLSFTKKKDVAKDLTQDVFLKVFTKLHTFEGRSKFSTWLYALTYNLCVNYKKKGKSSAMDFLGDSLEKHEFYLEQDEEDVDEDELFEIRAESLKIALEKIDPEDKALLLLKYQDEVSIKDLQEVMGLGQSAVKMRLKRARNRVVKATTASKDEKKKESLQGNRD